MLSVSIYFFESGLKPAEAASACLTFWNKDTLSISSEYFLSVLTERFKPYDFCLSFYKVVDSFG